MRPAHARILSPEPTGILQMGSLPGQFRMTLAGRPGRALFRGPSITFTGCGCDRDLGLFQQQRSGADHVKRPGLAHPHSHTAAKCKGFNHIHPSGPLSGAPPYVSDLPGAQEGGYPGLARVCRFFGSVLYCYVCVSCVCVCVCVRERESVCVCV